MSALPLSPETLHPSLWRGAQLARSEARTVDTGHPPLSAELPGGGWPIGGLIELLVPHAGCGELRLLAPGLAAAVSAQRPLAFVQPPYSPDARALARLGLPRDALLWLRTERGADALWAAEQALKAGSCGALLLWQPEARPEALRRLHLAAARSAGTLFFMMRPLAAAQQPSPAVLRVAVRPEPGGVTIDIVKRRGPAAGNALSLALLPSPILGGRHARFSRRSSAAPAAGRMPAAAAGAA
ncbi:translesion DNA synthesis-associated protein ImuA [Burkholderia alba]|uniref:translesion DNA synthesis-associated protein ImuA n=1 Tax=Burkholderia alba TaxID=2683677 RepID=UPI002B055396|nr:translesion DNA synthesis-associated protein ImuA [Burkholderia alba]